MEGFLEVAGALSDATRLRLLLVLREGGSKGICVCRLMELVKLAPSTVSKHMDILKRSGLVLSRKEGRWVYYRLAGREASSIVREGLRWAERSLKNDSIVKKDAGAISKILKQAKKTSCTQKGVKS